MRWLVLVCALLLVGPPMAEAKGGRTATIGWSDGGRWGTPYELDESTYAEDYGATELPQVVVRLVLQGHNRTVMLEYWDDIAEEWTVDDVQRTRRGTALLTPNPWCEDENGNEVWCDGVWTYRVRLLQEGALREQRSRGARVIYAPYVRCHPWDAWLCEEDL